MRRLYLLVLCLLFSIGGSGQTISGPATVLHNDPVNVTVAGLKPGSEYTLRGEFVSRAGTIWRSEAKFRADENGKIDLATDVPTSGSYSGIDPVGLIWSMQNTKERNTDPTLFENNDQSVVALTLREGNNVLATHHIERKTRGVGISSTDLAGEVTGTYLVRYATRPVPGVIVLGGSEGGTPTALAALIASHGYATLALGYFGMNKLPGDLDRIPVETVARGIDWLSKQPNVRSGQIIVVGISKGAELALLAASRDPRIKGVIAIAPSSVVFERLSRKPGTFSSWTIGGKEVPFAPFVKSEAFDRSRRLVDLYQACLDAAPAAAQIPVEKIRGPILLISGKDDTLWPAAKMAGQIADRLTEKKFSFQVTNMIFDDVGHHVANIPMRPTADSVRLGGKPHAIAKAQVESWQEIVRFLARFASSR